jgi:hypothetical protein
MEPLCLELRENIQARKKHGKAEVQASLEREGLWLIRK